MKYQSLLRMAMGLLMAGFLAAPLLGAAENKKAKPPTEEEKAAAAAALAPASWKDSARAGEAIPKTAPEESETKPQVDPADPATQPGTPEYKKAQKEANKKKAAEEKVARKEARERAIAEIRASKERAKARKEDEKELSKEEREDWEIREAALRYMLSVEAPGEVVFISFTPLDSVNMRWNDPPEGFLGRLTDLSVQLRPATKAILTREPVADPERPNRMVQDPVTKNAGSIYWAEVLKDSRAGETRVDTGCFRGFLKSWGCILIMKKVRGTWQVGAQTAVWKT